MQMNPIIIIFYICLFVVSMFLYRFSTIYLFVKLIGFEATQEVDLERNTHCIKRFKADSHKHNKHMSIFLVLITLVCQA